MTGVLVSALRGDASSLCALREPGDLASAIEEAARYGIEPLLRAILQGRGEWSQVPAAVKAACDAAAYRETAAEALRHRETKDVLANLHETGVATLVLKGAALAYTHYPAPYLRARADTDLLIRPGDRLAAFGTLERLRYGRRNSVSRDAIQRQVTFERKDVSYTHALDLHWAISNRALFANTLTFDELWEAAAPIPSLGSSARTLSPVHALLFASIHRVAHHDDSLNPLWLYDIKLLVESLTDEEWDRFWRLASEKQIVAVCGRSLQLAAEALGCKPSRWIPSGLNVDRGEASAEFIGGAGKGWRNLVLNLKGSAGLPAKLRFLAAYAFPDGTYMRASYGARGPVSMAAAYVRRGWTGLRRLGLQRSRD